MKISFTKKILIIGSIFCGLISPIQAADTFEISPRSKLRAASIYGVELCTNKQRNLVKSKEKIIKSVKSKLEKMNNISPDLIKDKIVIKIGENISTYKGNDCSKKLSREFIDEQYDLVREDISSVEKYEKLIGKKFTPELKSFYQKLRSRCSNEYVGKDLDECVTKGAKLILSRYDLDFGSDLVSDYLICYERRIKNYKWAYDGYPIYENLEECSRNNFAATKSCYEYYTYYTGTPKWKKFVDCTLSIRKQYQENTQKNMLADFRKLPQEVKDKYKAARHIGFVMCRIKVGKLNNEESAKILTNEFKKDKLPMVLFDDEGVSLVSERIAEATEPDCTDNSTIYTKSFYQENFLSLQNKNPKENNNQSSHQICLKAADYKGCMKYQNR